MSRFPAVLAIPVIVVAVLVTSCARSVTLGHEEAVEVMVLDGVNRGQAECVVSALSDQLDLEKITGLDVDLSEEELAVLAAISTRCAPIIAGGTGVLANGQPLDALVSTQQDGFLGGEFDLEDIVLAMVSDGLEADLGDCLLVELELSPNPEVAVGDMVALSRMISGCRIDETERTQTLVAESSEVVE